MATSIIKDNTVHRVSHTGTTGQTGVFGIPVSVFNRTKMDLVSVVCETAGYYAEGRGYYNGQLNVRIVRYDGDNYTGGSATVEVSYINR